MISEMSKVRHLLLPFCEGNGIEIGHGGDKVKPSVISVDLPIMYTNVGNDPTNLTGDGRNLYWFKDRVLDFCISSHLLEDFEDTEAILKEWCRVIKSDGKLILVLPDQQRYEAYCKSIGAGTNEHHKHFDFGSEFVKKRMPSNMFLIYESEIICEYNFMLVYSKKD